LKADIAPLFLFFKLIFFFFFLFDFLNATSIKDFYLLFFECNHTSTVLNCKPGGLMFSLLLAFLSQQQNQLNLTVEW